MRIPATATLLVVLALATAFRSASARQTPDVDGVFRGTWTAASDSGLTLRGQWSAQPHPDVPGAAHGSWTIVGAGRVVAEGTWSADKERGVWRGNWSARTSANRVYSGTWETPADHLTGDTLEGMLEQALAKQIAGSWRYGRLAGYWWIDTSSR